MRFYCHQAFFTLALSLLLIPASAKSPSHQAPESQGACAQCDAIAHDITMGKIAAAESLTRQGLVIKMEAQIQEIKKMQEHANQADPNLESEEVGKSAFSALGQLIEVASQTLNDAKRANSIKELTAAEKEIADLVTEAASLCGPRP